MTSPEHSRRYVKRERDTEDGSGMKSDSDQEDEEWEGDDKRKHRPSKSRRSRNGEEIERLDNSGRRTSIGNRNDFRKRSGESSRVDRVASDEEDHVTREKSRSKQMKRQEENTLEKLSNWYLDGELENKHDTGDKSRNKGHEQAGEVERRESTSNFSESERLQSKMKGNARPHDREPESSVDKDSRYHERRENSEVMAHDSSGHERISRRRWDESDAVRNAEENSYLEKSDYRSGKSSDHKHENARDRSFSARTEISQSKSRDLDSNSNKDLSSHEREDRRAESDRRNSKGRPEAPEGGNKASSLTGEDTSVKKRTEDHKQQSISISQDIAETHERSFMVEEGNTWARDKRKEVDHSNRSRTPERSGRNRYGSDKPDMNYEQSNYFRQKEVERDIYNEDRSRGRIDGWGDRSRDWDGPRDSWKRRHRSGHDKEMKDGDIVSDHGRERESQKRSRLTTVIEIQTKPFDYGREESVSSFVRRNEVSQRSDMTLVPNRELSYPLDEGARSVGIGSGSSADDIDADIPAAMTRGQSSSAAGQSSGSGSLPLLGNQENASSSRTFSQGKGARVGRGWARPTGRENQQVGVPMPMMGSPFGPLGMPPPGHMQPLNPSMPLGPVPSMSPGVFIPPFSPPVGWPGPRGVDVNMLTVPPGFPPLPSGAPRFPPNIGTPPNPGLYSNYPGAGRGASPNTSAPGFNAAVPMGRGQQQDKAPAPGGWVPPRTNGPTGKAPSRGEQNDYSQNFVDTGMRPQNFIRELELTSVVEDYPKLRELIQKKDEIVANSASPPMYFKCDLHEFDLSPEFFGTKFDVILVDPPWEEYVHRAPGVTDHMEYWTFEEIMNIKIEAIADTPSFIFLWVGDGVGLEQGRQCLKKWGFRRCEDICWVKTNKNNATPGLRHDSHTLFQRSKEHCLMGIKGTVRRSTDGHIIHANIDTDVIIAEEPSYGSTAKPEDLYRIIEHFALGRRRLELFGEDHNIRSGWLTVGKGLSSSNFDAKAYTRNFADKDGKVWQGGGGRNPPPEAPHLVVTTLEIEALRPKSPMKNQQQTSSISITTTNSGGKRQAGNSPQNYGALGLNQETSSSNPSAAASWISPMDGFRDRGGSIVAANDRVPDLYGYGASYGLANGDYLGYESHRGMNFL